MGLARPDSNTAANQPLLIYRHIIRWVESGDLDLRQISKFTISWLQLFTLLYIERIIDEEVFP